MKTIIVILTTLILSTSLTIGETKEEIKGSASFPKVNTYSIVAFDPVTGQFGGAVQSHWFHVSDVLWIEAGVGSIASQSLADFAYGKLGLDMMKMGKTAQQCMDGIIASDPNSAVRQVAMVDRHGNVATHTGDGCIAEAGHRLGENFSVQANLMLNNTVWDAMYDAFTNGEGDLGERMMLALEAAQAEGGDIRGMQSAAMVVVTGDPTGISWKDRIIDVRVDDSPQPLKELRRLMNINIAYNLMEAGDDFLAEKNTKAAAKSYAQAAALAPDNAEVLFWQAATMIETGQVDEAMPIFKKVFGMDKNWRLVIPRLVKANLLPDDDQVIKRILEQ